MNILFCKNPHCGKEVTYLVNGYCYECDKHEEEIQASPIYPLKIISLLEKIVAELSLISTTIIDIKYK